MNRPDLSKKPDIEAWIKYCRKMMIEVINMGLPIADEALFTHNEWYYTDILSWIAIWARSSEDHEHRMFASMVDHPVWIKNPTSWNIETAINSLLSAQAEHIFLLHRQQVKSSWNHHAHLILRGGNWEPNISLHDLQKAEALLQEKKILNPSIIIDSSHENSINPKTNKKDANLQFPTILNVIKQIKWNPINKTIKGFMVESFIKDWKQDINKKDLELWGQSITDECIWMDKTNEWITNMYKAL